MKPVALVLLFASTAAFAAGDDSASSTVVTRTDIRKEMLSEYTFEPHQAKPAQTAPFLAHEIPEPAVPDLVEAPPSSLRDVRTMNHLHAAIVQEEADAHAAEQASRLGIGVRSVRVGSHFAMGAATVFYIPVAIGIGFSW